MSIDILHRSEADAAPAGTGRAEPNAHPVLPEPEGRIDFTKMWNPLYMCRWVSIMSDWVYCSCSKFVVFISHSLVVDIIYNVLPTTSRVCAGDKIFAELACAFSCILVFIVYYFIGQPILTLIMVSCLPGIDPNSMRMLVARFALYHTNMRSGSTLQFWLLFANLKLLPQLLLLYRLCNSSLAGR